MLKLPFAKVVPHLATCAVVCAASWWAAAPARAQVAVDAGAKVAIGDASGSCKTDPRKKCVPADVAVYAPFDLRLGRWTLEGVQRDFDPLQFTVGFNPDVTVYAYGVTTRTILTANIGGGNSGLEWNLGGIWMFGGRLSLGQAQEGGVFGRVGLDTHLGGNSDYYQSHLTLPRFELGYQLIKAHSIFLEAAGRTGLTLAGRHEVLDRTRDLGFSLEAGGTVTLQLNFLRLYVDAVRVYEKGHQPETPVDRGQLDLCGLLSRVSLCLTAAAYRGEVSSYGDAYETRADFLGGKLQFTDARIVHDEF